MSNKMKRSWLIFLVISLSFSLQGFIPQERDFASEYQFRLYRSWQARQKNLQELPAEIRESKIKRTLMFDDKKVEVVFLWENWKVYRQYENLPALLPWSNSRQKLIIAGEILYRLNCRHSSFASDYIKMMPVKLVYQNLEDDAALHSLFNTYKNKRLFLQKLHPVLVDDELVKLNLILQDNQTITIIFDDIENYSENITLLKKFEWEYDPAALPADFGSREKITPAIVKKKDSYLTPQVEEFIEEESAYKQILHPVADSLQFPYEKKLVDWITSNSKKIQGSEMLNNKISDMSSFLQNEFPYHSLLINDNIYKLIHTPFAGNLKADLYLEITNDENWEILPGSKVALADKQAVIESESFDLSALSEYEANQISYALPQLLLSHRIMGSKLQGFILQPDITQTTLVVNGNKRHIFNIRSYHDLLLLLGNFWKNRTIYYTVDDFRLVDGYVEFKGFLAAEDQKTGMYDLAEIRYRLNEDHMLVLAMMVIYPQQHIAAQEGR